MTEFIRREDELSARQSLYDKDGFQMVVIYGRRRVGKATLVNKSLEKNKCKSVSFVSPRCLKLNFYRGGEKMSLRVLRGKMNFDSFDSIFDFIGEAAEERVV